MKAGIMAVGSGSRFVQAGWNEPKPLIRLKGVPIIHHVLQNLLRAGVDEVEVLLNGNERFDPVEEYLRELPEATTSIRVHRKITQSSFETFCCLLKQMGTPPFVISTVDSIIDPDEMRAFLDPEAYPPTCSLALAITDQVHDEKPLWVAVKDNGQILAMGNELVGTRYVTAGIYLVLRDLGDTSGGENFPALRYFLRHLLQSGRIVWSKPFQMALDIDGPEDIRLGEEVLEKRMVILDGSPKTGIRGEKRFLC